MSETVEAEANEPSISFREELSRFWHFVPNKALFFGQLILWILLFHFLGNPTFGYVGVDSFAPGSLFTWMYNSYNAIDSDDGHGNLIPFVVLVLLWWKRDELMQLKPRIWWPALSLVIAGLVLHIVGYMAQQPRISIVALFVGMYGLMGLCWGYGWLKATFFPFFLFAFCVPIGSLATAITFPLRMVVTSLAVGFSQIGLQIDVIREGTLIFDAERNYQYDVAAACSGIRSLISLFALTTIYGFITFKTTWKRILMMIMALPLAIAGNVVRIIGVIVTGDSLGQAAGKWVEQKLGFVTFLIAIVCVMLMGFWLRDKVDGKQEQQPQAA